ncbi:MAG TPA: hypothetical protein VMW24_23035 [Sedimentisphaerales bacterium]|nr:hypothetical protein [Sedimentisphaerales bacterium]
MVRTLFPDPANRLVVSKIIRGRTAIADGAAGNSCAQYHIATSFAHTPCCFRGNSRFFGDKAALFPGVTLGRPWCAREAVSPFASSVTLPSSL